LVVFLLRGLASLDSPEVVLAASPALDSSVARDVRRGVAFEAIDLDVLDKGVSDATDAEWANVAVNDFVVASDVEPDIKRNPVHVGSVVVDATNVAISNFVNFAHVILRGVFALL
jgi:hypothetical protein